MNRAAAALLAEFFGLGLVPLAPGTAASAVAAAGWMLALRGLPGPVYVLLVAALFLAGAAASSSRAAELGRTDPGRIVVDEVCGQLVASAFLPGTWLSAGLSFALFRVFDIIKPWPIRRLERLPGGWGIMADDIGAGLAAAVLARLALAVV
ncbi:MAG: phosphatidylglycerophosphatase A [Candidatus Aminicenantes bacterium]|nr:phosphatidylglycerophosphatase A [Candidatus Aminicenantes bacterium]NLH75960.1 phosphatidylglycerophosphatase A [Acidobacteriota bacterium]